MADLEPTSITGEGGETVRCRYCGQLNRARTDGGQARCGRCRLLLSNEPHVKFADLDKHSYVHPLDSRSLAALRAIPGLDKAVTKLLNLTGEPFLNVIMMASAVRVTPLQCPDLYAKLQVACTTLGVDVADLVRDDGEDLLVRQAFEQAGEEDDDGAVDAVGEGVDDRRLHHVKLGHVHAERRAGDLKLRVEVWAL